MRNIANHKRQQHYHINFSWNEVVIITSRRKKNRSNNKCIVLLYVYKIMHSFGQNSKQFLFELCINSYSRNKWDHGLSNSMYVIHSLSKWLWWWRRRRHRLAMKNHETESKDYSKRKNPAGLCTLTFIHFIQNIYVCVLVYIRIECW